MFGQRISLGRDTLKLNIPQKSKRVLKIILFCFLLIALRLWQLTVILHEENLRKSLIPGKKTLLIPPERGPITDRFGIPLAVNKIQYNIAILYADLREIPALKWEIGENGQKIKTRPRARYIEKLSTFLGEQLDLLKEDVEDLIYSKAALFQQVPYIIKKDVAEREFYRLKAAEKDWPGLHVEITSKRYYPQEKIAASAVGYMGAISRDEYNQVTEEIQKLRKELSDFEKEGGTLREPGEFEELSSRLEELENRAYGWNDAVGKAGAEEIFEKELRGFYGQSSFETDAKGNILRKLPGETPPIPGKKVTLALSSELQSFCEYLLARNEIIREGRSQSFNEKTRTYEKQKQPWIKGGAIIAMEPQSGEILALASYPRFDPNDFIFSGIPKIEREKNDRIRKWLELESHIGAIWDQKRPFEREVGTEKEGEFATEYKMLTWDQYLEFLFPKNNPVFKLFNQPLTLKEAYSVQVHIRSLLSLSGLTKVSDLLNLLYPTSPYRDFITEEEKGQARIALESVPETHQTLIHELHPFFAKLPKNRDKLLFLDLCRLAFSSEKLEAPSLIESSLGKISVQEHRDNEARVVRLLRILRKGAKRGFHQIHFKKWREENQEKFLMEKRREEKRDNRYARPYLDYLKKEEEKQFHYFWENNKEIILAKFLIPDRLQIQDVSLKKIETFLIEESTLLEAEKDLNSLKERISFLPPNYLHSYLKTVRPFKDYNAPLWGFYPQIRKEKGVQLERHLASAFYPVYGFGYTRQHAFQSYSTQGSIFKVVTAYKGLIKYYEALVKKGVKGAALNHLNPLEIIEQTHKSPSKKDKIMGYRLNGKPIYQSYKGGRLIKSTHPNIGRINLQSALEVSSNVYFALIAADLLETPEELNEAAKDFGFGEKTGIELRGEIKGNLPKDLNTNQTGLYAYCIGQHSLIVTPLQSAVALSALANKGAVLTPRILAHIEGLHPEYKLLGVYNDIQKAYTPYYQNIALSFPLFNQTGASEKNELSMATQSNTRWNLWMPPQVRLPILQGLSRFVYKSQTEGLWGVSRYFDKNPEAIKQFTSLKHQLAGKSSTAESVEWIDLDSEKGKDTYTHIWFGGISFKPSQVDPLIGSPFENPELVVIVYLKYGGWGKEAAPLAAQVVQKWREISVGKSNNI